MEIAISLGWNCMPAIKGIHLGIRQTKGNGYKTCPFDIGLSNYEGIINCLREDFEYICDTAYLKVVQAPFNAGPFEKGVPLIYNTRYNFIYNHESSTPDGGNLYLTENWSGGKTHFIDNNFEKFVERYKRRIENFKYYINNSTKIIFIISKYSDDLSELTKVLNDKYPNLNYEYLYYQEEEYSKEDFDKMLELMKGHSIVL